MSQLEITLLIFAMTAAVFLMRTGPMAFMSSLQPPPMIERALQLVPVAILSTLVASSVFTKTGKLHLTFGNAFLWATIISFVVAFKTKNAFAVIIVGVVITGIFQTYLV